MTKIPTLLITLACCVVLSLTTRAGKLDELRKQHSEVETALDNLILKGLGHAHPKVKQLEKRLSKLETDIENAKELHRETIILLEGTKSQYLAGHSRHGKTNEALIELLKAGWKIEKIIPAGTTKEIPNNKQAAEKLQAAYVWLSYEG